MSDKKGFGRKIKDAIGGALDSIKGAFGYDITAKYKVEESDLEVSFPVDMAGDTIWATQAQLATLYGVNRQAITKQIASLYESEELDQSATSSKLELVQTEGGREVTRAVTHYNLDVILAVGFALRASKRAVAVRKWAMSVLKGYITDGYALDGRRLDKDPTALLKLAQEVRAIRTSEKNLYAQVCEIFATMAIDYEPSSDEARRFFATSQDVCHFAASGKTATEIIVERADATKPNMGLTALGNMRPRASDVTVAKNYCDAQELRKMELIGEAFLLYAEGLAAQEKQISMARLLEKFTDMVRFYEYPVFEGYARGRPTREQADRHAKEQLKLFNTATPPTKRAS